MLPHVNRIGLCYPVMGGGAEADVGVSRNSSKGRFLTEREEGRGRSSMFVSEKWQQMFSHILSILGTKDPSHV